MNTILPHLRHLFLLGLALCVLPLYAENPADATGLEVASEEDPTATAEQPAEPTEPAPAPTDLPPTEPTPSPPPVTVQPPASAAETTPADLSRNAALHYLTAGMLMRIAATPEDLDAQLVIDRDLPVLPPEALALHPTVVDWLLAERAMVTSLGRGGEIDACQFPVYAGPGPAKSLDHLGPVYALGMRALAVAKLYRFVNNIEGAAYIGTDLLQMLRHLEQDDAIESSMAAARLMQHVSLDTFRFLGSGLTTSQTEIFTRHFARQKGRPFLSPSARLRGESQRLAYWLTEDPAQGPQRLGFLYGDATQRPAMELLLTLPPQRALDQMQLWIDGYTTRVERIAKAMERSYAEAYGELVLLEKDIEQTAGSRNPVRDNPLPSLMLVGLRERYDQLVLAQAQMDVIEIMAQAARFRSMNGRWPEELPALEAFMGSPLPRDRFSGESYAYSLRRRLPRVIIRVPTWIARESSPVFIYDLATFQKDDEDLLKKYADQQSKLRAQRQRDLIQANRKP